MRHAIGTMGAQSQNPCGITGQWLLDDYETGEADISDISKKNDGMKPIDKLICIIYNRITIKK